VAVAIASRAKRAAISWDLGELAADDLEGDLFAEVEVLRDEDGAHAPFAEQLEDAVAAVDHLADPDEGIVGALVAVGAVGGRVDGGIGGGGGPRFEAEGAVVGGRVGGHRRGYHSRVGG
jgi:hypothetical protein